MKLLFAALCVFCCVQVSLLLEIGSLPILHTQLSGYFVTGSWQTSPGVNPPEIDGLFNTSLIRNDKPGGQTCVEHYYCPVGDTRMFLCGFGFYNNATDGTKPEDCLPCPAGRYCFNGVYDCEPGYYCPGQSLGVQPHLGHYAPHSGMSQPLKCPAGSYQNTSNDLVSDWSGITTCIPCPEYMFCDAPGLPEPVAFCQDGWYCGINETSPRPAGQHCQPGEYCVQGKKNMCQAGYYQPNEAMAACLSCPVGSYCSEAGLGNVSGTCNPGLYCDFNTVEPQPCPAGNMCVNGEKVPCPRGYYQASTNQSTCTICPVGKWCYKFGLTAPQGPCNTDCCQNLGSDSKKNKPVGVNMRFVKIDSSKTLKTKPTYGYDIVLIDEFRFTVTASANVSIKTIMESKLRYQIWVDVEDKLCKYVVGEGDETYYSSAGIPACDLTAEISSHFWLKYLNYTLTQFGSGKVVGEEVIFNIPHVSPFKTIKFGSFADSGSTFRTPKEYDSGCLPGYYRKTISLCKPCPRGFYCRRMGESEPKKCSSTFGYYCEGADITTAPLGKYCPRGYECSNHELKPCGTYYHKGGLYTGHIQYFYNPDLYLTESCTLPCPEYFNCSIPGTYHMAQICQPGYYCTNGFMLLCEPGHFCYQGKKTMCPSGFTSLAGQDSCDRCSNDTYCVYGVTYPCPEHVICENGLPIACVAGHNCGIVNGSYAYIACQPGYHLADNGSHVCIECPNGTYTQVIDGHNQCIPCPPGFYCVSNIVTPCWHGHHCADEGMDAPIPCPPGYYQSKPQQTKCIICPVGYYCDAEKAAAEKPYCPECPTHGVDLPYKCPDSVYCNELGRENTVCIEDAFSKGAFKVHFYAAPNVINGLASVHHTKQKFGVMCSDCKHKNTTITWSMRKCANRSVESCRHCQGQYDVLPDNGTTMIYKWYDNPYDHFSWEYIGVIVKVQRGTDYKVAMRSKVIRFVKVSPYVNCTTTPTTGYVMHTNFTRVCTGIELKPTCDFKCLVFLDSKKKGKEASFSKKGSCDEENIHLPLGHTKKDFMLTVRVQLKYNGLLLWEKSHQVQVKYQPVPTSEIEDVATSSLEAISSQSGPVTAESVKELENVASILNYAPVVGLSESTVETNTSTSTNGTEPTPTSSSNSTDNSTSEQEWKEKKTKIRDDMVDTLLLVDTSSNLEDMTKVADILNKVTDQKDEISAETKKKSVDMYSAYTDQLKLLETSYDPPVPKDDSEEPETPPEEDPDTAEEEEEVVNVVTDAAITLLHGMASMVDMVTDDYQKNISQPLVSADNTTQSNVSTPLSNDTAEVESVEHQAATEEMKNTTQKLFQQVEDISSLALKHMLEEGEPAHIDTPAMSLSLEKQSPDKMKGKILKSENSDEKTTMSLPDDMNITGASSISSMFMHLEKNPFVWDEKAKTIQPPVVSLALKDENNTALKVSNLSTPISLDFKFTGSGLSTTVPLLLTVKKTNEVIQLITSPSRPGAVTFEFNVTVDHLLSLELELPPGIRSARLSIRTDRKLSFKDVISKGFRYPQDHDLIEELYSNVVSSYRDASDFNSPTKYCSNCAAKCCSSLELCTGVYAYCMYYCTHVIHSSSVLGCGESARSLQHQNMVRYCHECYDIYCIYPENCVGIYSNCYFICSHVMNVDLNLECNIDIHEAVNFHSINMTQYCDTCYRDCCPPTECSALYGNCAYICGHFLERKADDTCKIKILESVDFVKYIPLYCFICYAECCLGETECNKERYWNCGYRCNDLYNVTMTETCNTAIQDDVTGSGKTLTEYCDRCYSTCCTEPHAAVCDYTYSNCLYYCMNEFSAPVPEFCIEFMNFTTIKLYDIDSADYCQACYGACCLNPTEECHQLFLNCMYYCSNVLKYNTTSECENRITADTSEITFNSASEYCDLCKTNCCGNKTSNCSSIYVNCIYICNKYNSPITEDDCPGSTTLTNITETGSSSKDKFEPIFFYPRPSLFLGNQVSFLIYFGLSFDMNDPGVVEDLVLHDDTCLSNTSLSECTVDIDFQIPVGINDIGCTYWNDDAQSWSNEGLKLADGSGRGVVKCVADHLTAFSKAVIVVPAFVDPFDVEMFITVFENPVVVTVVIMVWVIYFFLIHWARQSDKNDAEQIGVINCPDNLPSQTYTYLVCVTTGWWTNAGTTSNVYLCLQGSHGNSAKKCLSNNLRMCFQTGYDDWFMITTEHSLGELHSVKLWHDNSGKNPHWFVNQLYVKDIQTDGVWTFIYNDWLAVDRGSLCVTTTVLQALTPDDINRRRKYNFLVQSTKDLRNGHLWISIFSKPPSSTFTRVQRLTCALSLLLTTMLTNIMFYGLPEDNPVGQVTAGDFHLSLSQIIIGIQSSLIMFPVNILIVQLFLRTKSRRRHQRNIQQNSTSKITLRYADKTSNEALKVDYEKTQFHQKSELPQNGRQSLSTSGGPQIFGSKQSENHSLQNFVRKLSLSSQNNKKSHVVTMVNYSKNRSIDIKLPSDIYRGFKSMCKDMPFLEKHLKDTSSDHTDVHMEILARKAQQFAAATSERTQEQQKSDGKLLPWWFIYIAWTVALSTCIVSSYFVMLYGLMYGYTTSVEWLVSFLTGFFQSIFIQQPLKVIGIAVILILILKKSVDFEESLLVVQRDEDDDYLKSIHVEKPEPHQSVIEPLPRRLMKQIRERLKIEWLMDMVLWDMVLHGLYLLTICMVVYGHGNIEQAYQNNMVVRHLFADPTNGLPLTEVSTREDFYDYLKTSLVAGMTILTSSHEEPMIGSDHYLVGTYRLRQLRVKPRECVMLYIGLTVDCQDSIYLSSDEDDRNFQGSWSTPLSGNLSTSSGPWVWQSTRALQSMPYAAEHGYYSGGGYVVDMPSDVTLHTAIFDDLQSNNWIDGHTRAVLVEFTLYNPNVDLFTIAMYMFEFTIYGEVTTMHHEFTSNLYQYSTGFTSDIILGQIAFILFNICFVYFEIKKLKKLGARQYFHDFWSYVEIVQICMAITAVGFFIKRLISLDNVMEAFKNSNGTEFISFHPTIFWHFVFTYVTASLVAMVTAKTIKMLKFNKHLQLVTLTIKHAKPGLINFIFIFLIASFGFTSMATLIFGRHIQDFQSFYSAWGTNIRLILGEIDFDGLEHVFSALGPLYVFVFTFTVTYGLLYLMMTMLNVAQIETIHKLRQQKDRMDLFNYLMSKVMLVFNVR